MRTPSAARAGGDPGSCGRNATVPVRSGTQAEIGGAAFALVAYTSSIAPRPAFAAMRTRDRRLGSQEASTATPPTLGTRALSEASSASCSEKLIVRGPMTTSEPQGVARSGRRSWTVSSSRRKRLARVSLAMPRFAHSPRTRLIKSLASDAPLGRAHSPPASIVRAITRRRPLNRGPQVDCAQSHHRPTQRARDRQPHPLVRWSPGTQD